MKSTHTRWLSGLAVSLTLASAGALAPGFASARDCSGLPSEHAKDPLASDGFQVIASSKLYRRQDRPWMEIPTGARILVRAPWGFTVADLHRVATCHVGQNSPLAVPGARLSVRRTSGDLYELRITAEQRGAALEIQHRAEALARAGGA
ncbi:MAG: hypothetical protein JWN48_5198 [Myxococcaceae bacterium]|nr:hypothetical protein [Myxococcaceae bacterium]